MEYVVIEDPRVRVFVKNGKVFVTTGALNFYTRDELEGVIAHELGHIALKHEEICCALSVMSIIAIAIAGFFLPLGWLLLTELIVVGSLLILRHNFEFEADQYAAELVGCDKIIAALEKAKKFEKRDWTHPPTEKRLKKIKKFCNGHFDRMNF